MLGKRWWWPVVIAGLCLLAAGVIHRDVYAGAVAGMDGGESSIDGTDSAETPAERIQEGCKAICKLDFAVSEALENAARLHFVNRIVDALSEFSVSFEGKLWEGFITYVNPPDEDMNLPYVDDDSFAVLKAAYDKVDFQGEFQVGAPEVQDVYKEKFLQLLRNEAPFIDPETGEEIYLQDFDDLGYDPETGYDAGAYEYQFFDIDGDGTPELGIKGYMYNNGFYYFKYDAASEQFTLRFHMWGLWEMWFGGRKIANPWGGGQYVTFTQLGKDLEMECVTDGYIVYYSETETLYMIMMPRYAKQENGAAVTEEMKSHGVFVRSEDQWYFRVTKEQFHQLTDAYYEAYHRACEEMKEVEYTYGELFGTD